MNKILVEVSVGELLDKVSILEIKQEKIKILFIIFNTMLSYIINV